MNHSVNRNVTSSALSRGGDRELSGAAGGALVAALVDELALHRDQVADGDVRVGLVFHQGARLGQLHVQISLRSRVIIHLHRSARQNTSIGLVGRR